MWRARLLQASWQRSIVGNIGRTPVIELTSLSRLLNATVLAKCEHLNPGGSVKDRAARWIVETAEKEGLLQPGDTIVEGGGGNTGIGLALVGAAKGYKTVHAVPESTSPEKLNAMRQYGTEVILCPSVPFSDERHYFHVAARLGLRSGHFFTNQFENLANSQAHYESTAPELWEDTAGQLDGFICSCGTGGTIGGVSARLKELKPAVQCWIIDPPSSGLLPLWCNGSSYIDQGESPSKGQTRYSSDDYVRYVQRSPGDGRAFEGIGIDRVTANFARAWDAGLIDGALAGTNEEAVDMAYFLMRAEGLAVGPSAALNVVGATRLARILGPGSVVATVLCDGAERYASKLLNPVWLAANNLSVTGAPPSDFIKDLFAS
eukprot:TRINITY_DN43708_c0_g1_i1.p1 TRINITY_DN43708_c0_g1~~TRINITY_DN43708_c0_g1_i1.p1  ORF type:complete len:376 (-),score=55.51 TRINITY_DN43708_c0_g1_i1:199-1326(-)